MSTFDDQTLLASLEAALRIDAAPSHHELEDLRLLVTRSDRQATVIPLIPQAPRVPRVRRGRGLRVAAVVASVLVASIGVAVLAGASMPRSLREPVRALGFGIDSQEMADARAATGDLRDALAQTDDRRVAAAAELVRVRLRALARDELRQLEPTASDLLRRADARLSTSVPGVPENGGGKSTDHDAPEEDTEAQAPKSTVPPVGSAFAAPSAAATEDDEDAEHESEHESERESEHETHEDESSANED